MTADLAVAAAIWTVAAFILPAQFVPAPPPPSLQFVSEWSEQCALLHDRAQTGMRTAFGIVGTAAWLASGLLTLQPGTGSLSLPSLAITIVTVIVTLPLGRRVAFWWERKSVDGYAQWLRAVGASKYEVTPLQTRPQKDPDVRGQG